MNTLNVLMDAVDAAGFDTPNDFSRDLFALHALALSTLPAPARERALLAIECGGLRQAVQQFDQPSPYPRASGNEGLQ
jgi:hypothetical protein